MLMRVVPQHRIATSAILPTMPSVSTIGIRSSSWSTSASLPGRMRADVLLICPLQVNDALLPVNRPVMEVKCWAGCQVATSRGG
jgi:hypothetical protein